MNVLAQALLYAATATRLSDAELQPVFERWHKQRPNTQKWNLNHASVMTDNGLQYKDFRTHRAWLAFKAGYNAYADSEAQRALHFRHQCEKAEQQLTGFVFALQEGFNNLVAWCNSCGLAPDEWAYIKERIGVEWMPDEITSEIDAYMAKLSTPTEPEPSEN